MKLKDMPPVVPEQSSINITPLIDIVFILLIFFMVTTTFTKDFWLGLERPSAKSALTQNQSALRVNIDRDGQISLDGEPIHSWTFQNKMQNKLSARSNKDVLIVSDKRLASGILIHIVDQCHLAGAQEVGVSTESES